MSSLLAVTTKPYGNGIEVVKLSVYESSEQIQTMHWYPAPSQHNRGSTNADIFAVGYSNGAVGVINKGGREEHRIDAHDGAVLSLKWNIEGTALATGGSDGFVKLWSRCCALRSNIYHSGNPVTAVAWSPDSTQILFASGNNLTIKHIQSSTRYTSWGGHNGLILGVDWNRWNRLILSIGEDGIYKIWDCFGRLLYKSSSQQGCLKSVSWCPSGEVFVVGGTASVMLCDKRGHILSKENTKDGSIKALAWTIDGNQVALGFSNGAVMFGFFIERSMEWFRSKVTLEDMHHIKIEDYLCKKVQILEFQELVVHMSIGFHHLIVITALQCLVYRIEDWRTQCIINVKDTRMILKQCLDSFLVSDMMNGLHVFTYEGRNRCNPLLAGLRTELLHNQNVGLSRDTLAFVDCNDPKCLRLFDTTVGKEMEKVIHHSMPIVEIDMNQQGDSSDRMLIFIDVDNDLYIVSLLRPYISKLASLTTKALWSSHAHIIAATVEQDLIIWLYPQAAVIDEDLLKVLEVSKECFKGKSANLHSFQGMRCMVQYANGAFVTRSVSPKPFMLFEYIEGNNWHLAKKLCWIFKERPLWAVLAAAAVHATQYGIAEEAYRALEQIDKSDFVKHIDSQACEIVRRAEHALFTRQAKDAESILINAGLIYRAVNLNLRLFNWDRALEIALSHKKHVDTVLWRRDQYLQDTHQEESKKEFKDLRDQVQIDVVRIKQAIAEEKNHEKNLKECHA
ncbi:hypothetical protein KP509_03G042400 [Ceratopteris richardii]|uniref:Intraflagellar transport protein 80 homolog n=1 Tax=Ceratopteris richardii TaxID=49495 RepID=A0A8T2V2Y9_CERRI|nr:hypothetical protein KP509_03G042400 [Ceratopteris richardii]